MRTYAGIQLSKRVKEFLEMVQPLPVKYGYSRGIKSGDNFVSYRDIGSTLNLAVGGGLISERRTYLVTVQTKTAESNIVYSTLIRLATTSSYISLVSEDLRKDVTVEDGWINTILLVAYSPMPEAEQTYSKQEALQILQEVADNYAAVVGSIDGVVITEEELAQESFSYQQLLEMKNRLIDAVVFE